MIELGVIEGFYGHPWSMQARKSVLTRLAGHGYRFYLYAPKADVYLNQSWQIPHPEHELQSLAQLSHHCHQLGIRFGLGLTPTALVNRVLSNPVPFNRVLSSRESMQLSDEDQQFLINKLESLAALGLDDLCIMFDDQNFDVDVGNDSEPGDAVLQAQISITRFIAEYSPASRLIFCPSYYSDDPLLDELFGPRPDQYLQKLGRGLDKSIDVFWAGPQICSKEISGEHLNRIANTLGRKPILWDNYPVNDGAEMSQYLHLRAFEGRAFNNQGLIKGHGINMASQALLSQIPAMTLVENYQLRHAYDPQQAFRRAASQVLGETLAALMEEDLGMLQDAGLKSLSAEDKRYLKQRYGGINHPACDEILAWLDGKFQVDDQSIRFLGQE